MKYVLAHIGKKKRAYRDLPLFEYIQDSRLSARQRLSFYPCMAYFIMAFGDLNKYMFRVEPAPDEHQAWVNAHTVEDDHHWPWYLEDYTKLGFDSRRLTTDLLRFLWGDETRAQRLLAYRLAAAAAGASSVDRLAMIEAIEEAGNVFFDLVSKIAKEVEAELGVELRYCGEFHLALEAGHGVGYEHRELARIELDDATRARCLALADDVFRWFSEWMHELLAYAKAHPLPTPVAEPAPPAPVC